MIPLESFLSSFIFRKPQSRGWGYTICVGWWGGVIEGCSELIKVFKMISGGVVFGQSRVKERPGVPICEMGRVVNWSQRRGGLGTRG